MESGLVGSGWSIYYCGCLTLLLLVFNNLNKIKGTLDHEEECYYCEFPAIFNFGDSNSDTGGLTAAFPAAVSKPYGDTFFHEPVGRYSDGRVIIDFIGTYPLYKFYAFFSYAASINIHKPVYILTSYIICYMVLVMLDHMVGLHHLSLYIALV